MKKNILGIILDMPTVNIEDKLYQDIKEYCRLNKLTINVFVNDLLKKNFMVEKYDDAPPFFKKKDTQEKVKDIMIQELTQEEFRDLYAQDPEPIKREKYIKPEVWVEIAKEDKKEEELTAKERARQRIKYL